MSPPARICALLVAGLLSAACESRPPNVILVSIDTLRADHLGSYGYSRETSPFLDSLAGRGVIFEEATAPAAWTVPSHASMLTGLYPRSHGLRFPRDRLPPDIATLPSMLSRHGYATGAVVNVLLLSQGRGFERGFDRFAYFQPAAGPEGEARSVSEEGLSWAKSQGGQPFLLFLHFFDVHSDFQPLPRYRRMFEQPYAGIADGTTAQLKAYRKGRVKLADVDARHLLDLYDAGIRQLDDALAELFAGLEEEKLLENTFVFITSDHGEEFFDHGDFLHGRTLYQELVHVPLLVLGPGLPEGVRVREPVSLVDLVPTILALLGLPAPDGVEGRDLSAQWRGSGGASPERALFYEADSWFHNPHRDFRRAVRKGRYKLHYNDREHSLELYDLTRDPGEHENLASERPGVVAELHAELKAFLGESRDPQRLPPPSDEAVEQLRQLGYAE
jgi:arylsulfatase A-like enzyme